MLRFKSMSADIVVSCFCHAILICQTLVISEADAIAVLATRLSCCNYFLPYARQYTTQYQWLERVDLLCKIAVEQLEIYEVRYRHVVIVVRRP